MAESEDQRKRSGGSILDRVISSQHAAAIEEFVPLETFATLMKNLSQKEQDVLRRRFGLQGEPETLEEIGRLYKVTRERIRQIENGGIHRIRNGKNFREVMMSVERLLLNMLNTHGGMMEEQAFFQEALSHAGNTPEQQRALSFILTELLKHRFERRPGDATLRTTWKLRAQALELARETLAELEKIIVAQNAPTLRDELVVRFKETTFYRNHKTWFTDDVIVSYLSLSARISRNPYGEYGLVEWGTIVPKRMNDKIYLVLKKHGKPLHFTEIARLINEAGFDKRRAYPPTVHNELILSEQYVLVGRGIYALREWGYKPGVVADVLVDVLTREQRPMTRDELVEAVLKQRLVKRNTILLALTNKELFQRLQSGAYDLVQKHS